jgi:hypothetical protein
MRFTLFFVFEVQSSVVFKGDVCGSKLTFPNKFLNGREKVCFPVHGTADMWYTFRHSIRFFIYLRTFPLTQKLSRL